MPSTQSTADGVRVDVVATTAFHRPADVPWETDADGAQALVEFAGRACYRSWSKPIPATATNAGYLRHVIEVGHLSVLEHAAVTLYIRNVSRAVTHEMIRHRHLSYSQLSQRHLIEDPAYVVPAPIDGDEELRAEFERAAEAATAAYQRLMAHLSDRLGDGGAVAPSKRTRQAAQALLPGARSTEIVVTGNLRAWRQFIAAHGTDQADDDLRAVAVRCLERLREVAPHVFRDFDISTLPDGRQIASSALVTEA